MKKFKVVAAGGEWHVVVGGSIAEKHPEVLARVPGWRTRAEADRAAAENNAVEWLAFFCPEKVD